MMNRRLFASCLWLGLASALYGQVEVDLQVRKDEFLEGEELKVGVRITNFSGRTLVFGETSDWVRINVEGLDGYLVPKKGEVRADRRFEVESSTRVTRWLNIEPYFVLEPGRYKVIAALHIKEWGKSIAARPASFTIKDGVDLWEQRFGMPGGSEEGEVPRVMKYSLIQLNQLRGIKLYCRVSDPSERRLFRVVPLGNMVSFRPPEPRLDRDNTLHVIHQMGAKTFRYTRINPFGQVTKRQTYLIGRSRPRLLVNEEGEIEVIGGTRLPSRSDYPPSKNAEDRSSPILPEETEEETSQESDIQD